MPQELKAGSARLIRLCRVAPQFKFRQAHIGKGLAEFAEEQRRLLIASSSSNTYREHIDLQAAYASRFYGAGPNLHVVNLKLTIAKNACQLGNSRVDLVSRHEPDSAAIQLILCAGQLALQACQGGLELRTLVTLSRQLSTLLSKKSPPLNGRVYGDDIHHQ